MDRLACSPSILLKVCEQADLSTLLNLRRVNKSVSALICRYEASICLICARNAYGATLAELPREHQDVRSFRKLLCLARRQCTWDLARSLLLEEKLRAESDDPVGDDMFRPLTLQVATIRDRRQRTLEGSWGCLWRVEDFIYECETFADGQTKAIRFSEILPQDQVSLRQRETHLMLGELEWIYEKRGCIRRGMKVDQNPDEFSLLAEILEHLNEAHFWDNPDEDDL
ncbi:hypothetical protein MMC09_005119 [Bachmanniomyces sp. S44760]|nr:hypothetical protein [Bachmanniomyces sp. S44760]